MNQKYDTNILCRLPFPVKDLPDDDRRILGHEVREHHGLGTALVEPTEDKESVFAIRIAGDRNHLDLFVGVRETVDPAFLG